MATKGKVGHFLPCMGCGKKSRLYSYELLVTHWYTPPRGCTEGDYWNEGEWQVVCPKCKAINRLMFNDFDLPWPDRYQRGAEVTFVSKTSKRSFVKTTDVYNRVDSAVTYNNYYIDSRRRLFGLPEKVKKQ